MIVRLPNICSCDIPFVFLGTGDFSWLQVAMSSRILLVSFPGWIPNLEFNMLDSSLLRPRDRSRMILIEWLGKCPNAGITELPWSTGLPCKLWTGIRCTWPNPSFSFATKVSFLNKTITVSLHWNSRWPSWNSRGALCCSSYRYDQDSDKPYLPTLRGSKSSCRSWGLQNNGILCSHSWLNIP